MTQMTRRTRSDGFTLVEVLVSMAVMGLIATVISSVVIVAVRNNPAVQMRTDSALTLQGITTWLPQDVDSTPPSGFSTVSTKVSGCASSSGTNILHMQWSENISGTVTQFIADYRYVASATQNIIQRVSCNGTGSLPLGNTIVQRVTGPLAAMPPTWVAGQLPAKVDIGPDLSGDGTLVVVQLMSANNQLLRVEAAPKNPANTLPPNAAEATLPPVITVLATTTSTTLPPTTTSTTTTTTTTVVGPTTTNPVPTTTTSTTSTTTTSTTTTTIPVTTTTVAPCVVTSASMSSASIKNTPPDGNGNSSITVGVLATPLTITVQTTGYCTGLIASPSRGAPNGELFRNFSTSNGTTYTVMFPGYPQGSSELWADGNRTITFSSATGGPYGSVTLQVK